jgi:hypothetical protein
MVQIDPKIAVVAAAALVASFETLRRLNDGHVKGMLMVPFRPVRIALGPPHGLQP